MLYFFLYRYAKGIHVWKAAHTVKLRRISISRKVFATADWLEECIHQLTAARLDRFEPVTDHKPAPRAHRPMDPAGVDEILRRTGI